MGLQVRDPSLRGAGLSGCTLHILRLTLRGHLEIVTKPGGSLPWPEDGILRGSLGALLCI